MAKKGGMKRHSGGKMKKRGGAGRAAGARSDAPQSPHTPHHQGDKAAVLYIVTVSDSRTTATDEGGALLATLATAAGHRVNGRTLVADEGERIRDALLDAVAAPETNVVILTGGTGMAPRDITPDAVEPLLTRALPGFGEAFRRLSHDEVGPIGLLSRAFAGVLGHVVVFGLPGSPKACRTAMEQLILPMLPHLVGLVGSPSGGAPTASDATSAATRR